MRSAFCRDSTLASTKHTSTPKRTSGPISGVTAAVAAATSRTTSHFIIARKSAVLLSK